MKYKAMISITETFDAPDKAQALKQAEEWQEYLATSNSGSEILANAPIIISEGYKLISD